MVLIEADQLGPLRARGQHTHRQLKILIKPIQRTERQNLHSRWWQMLSNRAMRMGAGILSVEPLRLEGAATLRPCCCHQVNQPSASQAKQCRPRP